MLIQTLVYRLKQHRRGEKGPQARRNEEFSKLRYDGCSDKETKFLRDGMLRTAKEIPFCTKARETNESAVTRNGVIAVKDIRLSLRPTLRQQKTGRAFFSPTTCGA